MTILCLLRVWLPFRDVNASQLLCKHAFACSCLPTFERMKLARTKAPAYVSIPMACKAEGAWVRQMYSEGRWDLRGESFGHGGATSEVTNGTKARLSNQFGL